MALPSAPCGIAADKAAFVFQIQRQVNISAEIRLARRTHIIHHKIGVMRAIMLTELSSVTFSLRLQSGRASTDCELLRQLVSQLPHENFHKLTGLESKNSLVSNLAEHQIPSWLMDYPYGIFIETLAVRQLQQRIGAKR